MNLFRTPKWNAQKREWERPLDLKYLRVASVYRLLKRGVINHKRALELLAERHTAAEMKSLRGTVELWNIPRAA